MSFVLHWAGLGGGAVPLSPKSPLEGSYGPRSCWRGSSVGSPALYHLRGPFLDTGDSINDKHRTLGRPIHRVGQGPEAPPGTERRAGHLLPPIFGPGHTERLGSTLGPEAGKWWKRNRKDYTVAARGLSDQSLYWNRSHDEDKRSHEILKKLATRKADLRHWLQLPVPQSCLGPAPGVPSALRVQRLRGSMHPSTRGSLREVPAWAIQKEKAKQAATKAGGRDRCGAAVKFSESWKHK